MSAFEVNLTPNRNKPSAKTEKLPTDVILAPFTAKAIVTFEDVPVSKTARRILNIINTTEDELKVMLTKSLNPEYNMCLEWTSTILPANGCKRLEMTWNPMHELHCRETIQFTDNRNFRKDVSVVLKSIKKTKTGTKRFPSLSSNSGQKFTLKLKSQVPQNTISNRKSIGLQSSNLSSNRKSIVSNQSHQTKTAMIQKQFHDIQMNKINHKVEPVYPSKQNCGASFQKKAASPSTLFRDTKFSFDYSTKSPITNHRSINKENISPLTPENASSIFDKIKFTPVTVTKCAPNDKVLNISPDLEYLASLPTPVNIKERKNSRATPLAIKFSPEPQRISTENTNSKQKTLSTPQIFVDEYKGADEICQDTYIAESKHIISPGRTYIQDSILDTSSEPRKSLGVMLINNKTFDLKNQTSSCENLLQLQTSECQEATNVSFNAQSEQKNFRTQLEQTDTIVKKTTRLSSIAETEESFRSEIYSKHSNISTTSQSLKRDIKLIGTPLRKCSESLRDLSGKSRKNSMGAMGSMPDLNNMETLQSIEQNRYYYQQNSNSTSRSSLIVSQKMSHHPNLLDISNESCISNAELCFNQNEIRAASSRFNINEGKNSKITGFISPTKIKQEPITPGKKKFKSPIGSPISYSSNMDYLQKRNHYEVDSPSSSNNSLAPARSYSAIAMAVSPPKRTKFESEFNANRAVDNSNPLFRVVSWKTSQPIKRMRIQKSLSLVRKPITPRKIKEEPRQMLYNTENFLQHYINPDPFAATTTLDPFLASTMYLEEEAIRKYEIQFKKWLNALVSMPSELDPNCEEKVDVGRLFNEVRNKELILAPTKEEQSMNYLTKSRMEALRSAAIKLFMSDEMCTICSKIAVHIKKSAIKIRLDRDLHLDVVMQRTILELLLSFNPLWLRLGLEVVFGEVIHLHSNSDIVGLSTFILNRLFRDKFIERKYSKAYTLSDEYRNHMKSFTLQKILFLLLFLDKAKNNRIIKHNPCLFVKKSPYKETKEILLRISSELLASVGDITRELRRFGYVLSHKQCFIDEFDYAFKNLAVDLRDGVRLTRIMEIILLRENLTTQLRCPAISRLQRIFNVQLGLKALSEADFQLKGEISASDIVDGHREKTLSLLWQIIYKFRSPKFIAASNKIQQWWRKKWLRVVICRRIKIKKEHRRNKAASLIQSTFRGFITRKYINLWKQERNLAAICIQKYWRRILAQKRFLHIMNSIYYIQRWYRNQKLANTERCQFLQIKTSVTIIQRWYKRIDLARKINLAVPIIRQAKENAKLRHEKAIILQHSIRSFIIHKKFHLMVNIALEHIKINKFEYKCAAKVQAFVKMVKVRRQFLLKKQSATIIQKFWRSFKLAKIERARFLGRREAIKAIQSFYRSYLLKKSVRSDYLSLKEATISVQNRFRANRLCKVQHNDYKMLKCAVIIIQQHFRANCLMKKCRSEYQRLAKSTIWVQTKFRGNRLCRLQRNKYQTLRRAAIIIQSNFRAMIARRKFKTLRSCTICIQRYLRSTILTKTLRYKFITLQYQTILMQQRFRANKLMKVEQKRYIDLKNATILIQNHFRAAIAMKEQRIQFLKFRKSVCIVQARFRAKLAMRREHDNFFKLKRSVLTIQRHYRATKVMQTQRKNYQLLLQSTLMVQRRFRANTEMKRVRKNFIALRNSTIVLQSRYRAFLQMRSERNKYISMKNSAIVIQQRYRALKLMQNAKSRYESIYKSTVIIQNYLRATILRNNERQMFLRLRQSTVIIQQRWRALKAMRMQRDLYNNMKTSAATIQQRYKAYRLMRVRRTLYLSLRAKTVFIQRLYRANRLKKIEQEQYLNLRRAALILQSRWRAIIEMRKQRQKYLELKQSVIIVQQRYRANKLMQIEQSYYENLYIAVLCVQQVYKAKYLMRQQRSSYLQMRNAAVKIQLWLRATFVMRNERKYYLELKIACNIVQKRFREKQLMVADRSHFLKVKNATIKIQNYYRSTVLMRSCRCYYIKLQQATSLLQIHYRRIRQFRYERAAFLKMKQSAIIIQRAWISFRQMRKKRDEYLKLRHAVIFIQQKYRAGLQAQAERQNYLMLKETVHKFQTHCRGFIARKRFNAAMTPEMREFIIQRKAAKTIQRYWRGFMVRRKWRNVRLQVIREKIKELKSTATACNTVRYKITSAVKYLNVGKYNVQEELGVLLRLEKLSRTVPHFLMDHSSFISTFCYSIMAQAIRSEIDKQIIELCSRIILNLARYNSTTANTFQENGLVTIAQMLLRWCDKESGIFNTLCTLVWIFSHCPHKNKVIRAFMTTPESIYMLRETKKLVLRKEKMRQNVRRSSIVSTPTIQRNTNPKTLPSLEPDFGIIQGKPYTFISSVFAFDIVLNSLGIKEIY